MKLAITNAQRTHLQKHCAMVPYACGTVMTLIGLNTDHWVENRGDHFGLWNYCNIEGCKPVSLALHHDWLWISQLLALIAEICIGCGWGLLVVVACSRRDLHPLDALVAHHAYLKDVFELLFASAGTVTLASVINVLVHIDTNDCILWSLLLTLVAPVPRLTSIVLTKHKAKVTNNRPACTMPST